jgi:O-methyltransferase domain
MRYGTNASNVGEWLALKLGKVPLPILDVVLAPLQSRALMVAVRRGILQRLARAAATTDALASDLALDRECVGLVLRLLRSMGYLEIDDNTWALSAVGRRYFGEDASEPYSAFVEYGPAQWEMIEKLDRVLESGKGIDFHDTQSAADWDAYQRGMFENARAFSWFVDQNLPVRRGATKCIDLAGAHGWVGASLCRKYPGLTSVVLDRPEAIAHARPIAERSGYADVVTFVEGDVRTSPLGTGNDVALLCNILHHFSEAENRAILGRAHAALRAGATIGIFEIETPEEDAGADAPGDAFALYFRITSTSTCFRGRDYTAWLEEAGFVDVRVVRSVRMPSRMLVVGRA